MASLVSVNMISKQMSSSHFFSILIVKIRIITSSQYNTCWASLKLAICTRTIWIRNIIWHDENVNLLPSRRLHNHSNKFSLFSSHSSFSLAFIITVGSYRMIKSYSIPEGISDTVNSTNESSVARTKPGPVQVESRPSLYGSRIITVEP